MAARYFRAIDGLGRIVLPAELLHHLNWKKGKMSVSIEEKDGSLIVSSVPAAGRPPAPPSPVKFQDSPDGQSKIISLPVSKKWKNAFLSSNKKAVFFCFCSFGGWTSTVGRFWKIDLKKPGNPHEYWKKSGWQQFRHPFLGGSDEIVVRWFNAIWKDFISPKIKTSTQQNENHRFRIDTFDCFYNPFFLFFLFDVPFL